MKTFEILGNGWSCTLQGDCLGGDSDVVSVISYTQGIVCTLIRGDVEIREI